MANQAIDFLKRSSKEQPWCLSVSFKAPHQPFTEFDPEFAELFKSQQMPLSESATREAENSQPKFIRDSLNGSRYWGLSDEKLQEWIRNYYRLVKGVDRAVGRIVEALSDLDFKENTIVIFTSDNGYLLFEHGLLGKWLMYEESIRIPMIVYDPRLPDELRGQRRDEMVLSIDCAPTMLALAGLPIPSAIQGRDLTPLIWGKKVPWREDWFYEHAYTEKDRYIPKSQGVRTNQWKYIRYVDQNPNFEQLFDLENDRLESTNLAEDPAQAETLNYLRERLSYWTSRLPNQNPEVFE
jgi:arylsulfatase A-like enzyme